MVRGVHRPQAIVLLQSHISSENLRSLHESTMNDAILDSVPRLLRPRPLLEKRPGKLCLARPQKTWASGYYPCFSVLCVFFRSGAPNRYRARTELRRRSIEQSTGRFVSAIKYGLQSCNCRLYVGLEAS